VLASADYWPRSGGDEDRRRPTDLSSDSQIEPVPVRRRAAHMLAGILCTPMALISSHLLEGCNSCRRRLPLISVPRCRPPCQVADEAAHPHLHQRSACSMNAGATKPLRSQGAFWPQCQGSAGSLSPKVHSDAVTLTLAFTNHHESHAPYPPAPPGSSRFSRDGLGTKTQLVRAPFLVPCAARTATMGRRGLQWQCSHWVPLVRPLHERHRAT